MYEMRPAATEANEPRRINGIQPETVEDLAAAQVNYGLITPQIPMKTPA